MRHPIVIVVVFALTLGACAPASEISVTTPADAIGQPATQSVDEILQSFEEAVRPTDIPSTSLFTAFETPLDPDVTVLPIPTALIRTPAPGELPIGDPRTLIASETEDPDGPALFEQITLIVSGGPLINGQRPPDSRIEITRDGRITRDTKQGTIDQASIDRLNALINAMNFFGAQGNYVGNFGADDTAFYYSITVKATGARERTLNAHEGLMPVELKNLIGEVLVLSARAQ